jgi:hypothetical protein
MIKLLGPDTAPTIPFPEISTGEFVRPRGLLTFGGPPLSGRLPSDLIFYVEDGYESGTGLPDFMRGAGFILVSQKLRSLIEKGSLEVEFLPANLSYHDRDVRGFFIMNPLRRIRGVNFKASQIELDEAGLALSVDKLVLDESKFSGVALSVLHETLDLAVQQSLADSISAAECVGCKFVDPESVQF